MDRFKKLKKEKSGKSSKDKQPLFITDVKSFKENIKIKEILRTVKMNRSMRLKAPPGSKVMNNNFNDDGCFDESSAAQNSTEILSATNPEVVFSSDEQNEIDTDANSKESTQQTNDGNEIQIFAEGNEHPSISKNCVYATKTETSSIMEQSTGSSQSNEAMSKSEIVNNNNSNTPTTKSNENNRDRKLSLDPTILSRREGLSQSELDLHSIGKSPLERKSSFFRKTMDSFVKNTTEMFKKQNKSLQRRVSMSVSLQSLNDKSLTSNDYREVPIQQVNDASDDNRLDVLTPTQIARSNSSLSSMVQGQSSEQSLANSYTGSQPTLHPLSGSTMEDLHSSSAHSLNEAYFKDAIMNSRAISMSSGLDSRIGHPRRKSSRFNRMESRSRASPEQFAALLEFMESRGDIARPQQGSQARVKADRLWQELGELLNSLGGGVRKTTEKWKKVWADWKTKTKKKALIIHREATGTGGGPSSRLTLSAPEQRLLAIMGLTAVVGQVGVEERGFDEIPPPRNSPPPATDVLEVSSQTHDFLEGISLILPPPPSEVSRLPPPQTITPPPARVTTPTQSTTSPIATTSGVPRRQRHPATPSPTGSTPRRERLLRARTRRAQTPFERATSEFVGVENRRLQLEEVRERNHHQREMERLRLESRRIEMEENRNVVFTRLNRVLDNLTEYMRPASS